MTRILFAIALALLWNSAPAIAQPRDITPLLEQCSPDTAKPVTIAQLHSDPSLRFECVSVEGVLDGERLAASRLAVVSPIAPFDPYGISEEDIEEALAAAPTSNRIRLQRSAMPRGRGPMRARITGIANDCAAIYREANAYNERRNAERTDGTISITFLGGTCHYHSEVYIDPVAVSFLEFEPLPRLTASDISAEQSDLIEFDENELPEGMDLRYAEMLLQAVRNDDQAFYYIAAHPDFRPDALMLEDNFNFGAKVINEEGISRIEIESLNISYAVNSHHLDNWLNARKARTSARNVPSANTLQRKLYFLKAALDFEAEFPEDDHQREVIVCWCKTGDCSGKWPVFSGDADALRDRPYFCVMLEQMRVGDGDRLQTIARMLETENGFVEPDWDDDGRPG